MADVAVVIPVYGRWEAVERLVRLLEHAASSIVIVDDASDASVPQELMATPGVTVIRHGWNRGFAAAVNTGVSNSQSEVVAVVNSDVLMTANGLQLLAATATAQGAIVGPRTIGHDGVPMPTARRWQTGLRMIAEFAVPLRAFPSLDVRLRDVRDDLPLKPVAVDWLVGSCLVFPRTVWDRVGPMDERYHMNSEELDWQLRASRIGVRRTFVPDVEVTHAGGASSGAKSERFARIWRARWLFLRLHRGRAYEVAIRGLALIVGVGQAPALVLAGLLTRRPRWGIWTAALHLRVPFLGVPVTQRPVEHG